MKINKLVLQNFKRFSQKTLEFGDGINVIVGENEAGKSTIVEALFQVLYGNPTSRSKDLTKFYSWGNDKPFRLEIEFEIEGQKYSLTKDFQKREAVLILPSAKQITNPDLIQDYLYTELKIPLKSIYMNSAFIKQDEVINLDYDGEFRNSIQNMVVEGDDEVDISNILKGLDKKIASLTKGLKGNTLSPGPIKALIDKIAKDQIGIADDENAWNISLGSRKNLGVNITEIKKLTDELDIKGEFLKKITKAKELSKKFIEANSKYDELALLEEDYGNNGKDIEGYRKIIKEDYYAYKDLKEISGLENEIKTLIAQEEILFKVEPKVSAKESVSMPYKVPLIIGIALIGIITSLILKDILPFIIAMVSIGIFLLSIKFQHKTTQNTSNNSINDNDLQAQTRNHIKEICQEFGADNIEKVLKDINKIEELNSKIAGLELKNKYIVGKSNIEEIKNNKKAWAREIIKIEELTKEYNVDASSYTDERLHQLEYDFTKTQTRLQNIKDDTLRLEAKLSNTDLSLESINIQKEQLEENKNELNGYRDELEILQLVRDSINKSYEETVKDSKVVIEESINKSISDLTNGRYSKAKLSSDLVLQVYSKEKGDFVELESLSRGTIDQIYLLMRLGFAEGLLGVNRMPIILDDPFVNFDEKRLLNIKEILVKLSPKYQLVLFSHNRFYSEWGRLIELD